MRYFRIFAWLLLAVSGIAFASEHKDSEAINDVVKRTLEAKKSSSKDDFYEILKAKEEARKIAESGRLDWLNGKRTDTVKEALKKEQNRNDFFDEAFTNDVTGEQPVRSKYPENATYVFVSLSMPQDALESLFYEAVSSNEQIVFVTRGWKQREFTKTISRFARLFPTIGGKRKMPAMMTDPTLYRSMEINAVPAFAHKTQGGAWAIVYGNSDIRSAVEYIESGLSLEERLGPVFEIEEPDLLAEIQRAGKNHDWSQQVNEIKKNVFKNQQMVYIPDATENGSYLVDMSIEVKKDIRAENQTYAHRGDVVNPLSYVSVTHKYVFADVTKASHLRILREWKEKYPLMRVMSVDMPSDEEKRKALSEEFGYIGIINKLIVKRFKVKAIPAISWQEGLMMKMTMRIPSE